MPLSGATTVRGLVRCAGTRGKTGRIAVTSLGGGTPYDGIGEQVSCATFVTVRRVGAAARAVL
ncbi:hypothetical protein GCM10025786_24800 [Nocardioides caeni]